MSGSHYRDLLRNEVNAHDTTSNERKRRRRNVKESSTSPIVISDSNDQDVIEIEEDELAKESDVLHSDSSDSDSDDFEDVAIHSFNLNPMSMADKNDDSITVSIGDKGLNDDENPNNSNKRRTNIISKEERKFRVLYHQSYLLCMIVHGSIRNKWCNDLKLQQGLEKKIMSPEILELLQQRTVENREVLDIVKSRRFLDGLKRLMLIYSKKFRVSSKGIIRRNWNELKLLRPNSERDITKEKFSRLISSFRGSRDIGAQGFVALLRSIRVKTRLVFSVQPPDFTSTVEYPKIEEDSKPKIEEKKPAVNKLLSKFGGIDGGAGGAGNSKRKFLGTLRDAVTTSISQTTSNTSSSSSNSTLEDSQYPVFWVEVWNKYSKKWVSIDPICLKIIENVPMRRKSAFEPPSTDTRNQLTYVFAYNRFGGVKDVTRRYSQYYNAKTCKKRIPFRVDSSWYERLIRAVNSTNHIQKVNKIDVLEMKEFHDRDLAEGMPNNLSDFKNHPLFALESQLRQNEVIYPMDKSSQCGMFRNKTKSKTKEVVIPIFKRSNVYLLRSARAWYMRGRTLKVGANPLKVKTKVKQQRALESSSNQYGLDDYDDDIDEDDDTVRLYAEFQTILYIPPPILDGKIPKNAYGNIDIYTPTMVPENGYLIRTDGAYTMKMAERAAKYILEIDYARAVVGFDFGGDNGKKKAFRRIPTTKEGGIIIDIQYKEAMILVLNSLVEEAEEAKRDLIDRNSLQNWKFFLTKLRISHRLDVEHGQVGSKKKKGSKYKIQKDEYDSDANSSEFSVHSDDSGSSNISEEDEEINRGGFVVDDYKEDHSTNENRGGFLVEEDAHIYEGDDDSENGSRNRRSPQNEYNAYSAEEELMEDGGFIVDPNPTRDHNIDIGEGGFTVVTENKNYPDNEMGGGFIIKGNDNSESEEEVGGGFIIEDNENSKSENEVGGGGSIVNEKREKDNGYEKEAIGANVPEHTSRGSDVEEQSRGQLRNYEESDSEFLDSVPDTYFRENERGELVYDPADIIEKNRKVESIPIEVPEKKLEERAQFEPVGAKNEDVAKSAQSTPTASDNEKYVSDVDEDQELDPIEANEVEDVVAVHDEFGFEYESD
ncbi:hypothetical protein CLIB1423_01S11452 [[Candida] railenensis]|uniref:DNA repair protein RAD4 n=1 Tax=[Candida] railenensis TaxID=45579 RepID=A0A9P0QL91_9ASCO|nr:hypothetical protein CLIB1423_01S11452 [[Candida] railenensis]